MFIKHFKRCFFLLLKKVIFIEDIRCPYCNQLLLKAEKVKGEIKCLRCKNIIKLDKETDKHYFECPNCGNTNQDKMNIARRVCG